MKFTNCCIYSILQYEVEIWILSLKNRREGNILYKDIDGNITYESESGQDTA